MLKIQHFYMFFFCKYNIFKYFYSFSDNCLYLSLTSIFNQSFIPVLAWSSILDIPFAPSVLFIYVLSYEPCKHIGPNSSWSSYLRGPVLSSPPKGKEDPLQLLCPVFAMRQKGPRARKPEGLRFRD